MTESRKLAIVFAAIVLIGLITLAFEWLRSRVNAWLALLILSLIILVMALSIHPIRARDLDGRYAGSPLKQWFDGLRSGKGPCCSDADGFAISDADWKSNGGRYSVRIPKVGYVIEGAKQEMIWMEVPEDAVITEPNREGRTMVWPIVGYQGITIRCFMPGSMT
jgi:hypothetical protein